MVSGGAPPRGDRHIVGLLESLLHPGLEYAIDPFQQRSLGAEVLHKVQGCATHQFPQCVHLGYVSPAKAVDGLFGIPDDEQLARFRGHLQPRCGTSVSREVTGRPSRHGPLR